MRSPEYYNGGVSFFIELLRFIRKITKDRKEATMKAFVLSGGGNRGALQVGALEFLLEREIYPDMVVGVSAGSINAAMFASDPTLEGIRSMKLFWMDDLPKFSHPLQKSKALMRLALGKKSLYDEASRQDFYQNFSLGERKMGEFTHPKLYITAVSLPDGGLHVFGDNPDELLGDAVMSSTALPPLYSPWQVDGRVYVDGGACSNLPLRVAVERGADEIYALNLIRPKDVKNVQLDRIFTIGDRTLGSLLDYTMELEIEMVKNNPNLQLHLINLKANEFPPIWDLSQTETMINDGRQLTEQYFSTQIDRRSLECLKQQ